MPYTEDRPYVITAKSKDGLIQHTRMKAAGAMVLVMSLRMAGYTDIQVRDPMGNLLTADGQSTGRSAVEDKPELL